MLPIRDTIRTRNVPVVNLFLIGINVLVFFYQSTMVADPDRFIYLYGLVPARYSLDSLSAYFTAGQQLFSFFSFMFLHGGFLHLLGNMWFLYIFGDNIEDTLGPLRYLGFYLLCGLASGLSHLILNVHSNIPTVGASGAIAGVMGAYFLLYPKARILTLIPILIIPYFIEIPAFFFIGIWFLLQFINAAGASGHGGGIAWWAHIGGFIFGMLFLRMAMAFPRTGITDRMQPITAKKRTHRLQVIQPVSKPDDIHLHGTITISGLEARRGTQKLINIPWGFQKRMFRVTVPPGIRDGSTLRLRNMGKLIPGNGRGDLYLRVNLED
jgi:membrane associated rhomboid family serine protease